MATVRHCPVRALLLVASVTLTAEGIPIPALSEHALGKRQSSSDDANSSNGTSNISPKVWVPVVAVVLVLLGVFCFIWTRTSVLARMRGVVSRSGNSTSGTREITASQLAGTSNNALTTNGVSNANTGSRTGRTRRNRRRASQMSTTSLPVYMKEPGDMELVIFRGPEQMDASDAIAEAREAEDAEDTEDQPEDDRDQLEAERDGGEMRENRTSGLLTLTVPAHGSAISPDVSMQSLGLPSANGDDDEPDTSTTQLLAEALGHQRSDSGGTTASASTSSLGRPGILQRVSEVPSEAPPSYESNRNSATFPPGLAVSSSLDTAAGPNLTETASAQARAGSQTPNTMRFSQRLSRILHLRSGSGASNMSTVTDSDPASSSSHLTTSGPSPEPPEPAYVMEPSGSLSTNLEMAMHSNLASVISLNEVPPSSSGTTSRPPVSLHHSRHRASQSGGSTSTLNLIMPFRTVSRQRSTTSLAQHRSTNTVAHSRSMVSMDGSASGSNANLTSPSLLSLSVAQGNNPISAPLSHTLVRTEIRYPAGGPTPDQIKLLSSREGFERFAMPYGEHAVAHARRSRADLLSDPPPIFESPTTEVGRSAAREAREGRSGDDEGRESMSNEGPDPDALPEGFNTSSTMEEDVVNATIDARVFVPMFM